MFREFLEEIRGVRQLYGATSFRVVDAVRFESARDLLDDALVLLADLDPSRLDREPLRRWINVQYDVSRSAVEVLKGSTTMPQVPPPRT